LRSFDTEELSTLSSITAWAFTLILRNAMASPRTREHPHKSLAKLLKIDAVVDFVSVVVFSEGGAL
jgi:hypothetical protein